MTRWTKSCTCSEERMSPWATYVGVWNSVPPEYVGRRVWVRWDSRLVRVLNRRFEEIAVHVRHEQGRFSTDPFHIPSEIRNMNEYGRIVKVVLGDGTAEVVPIMTSNRPIEDWGKLVGDVPSATAILDRFLQHAEIITTTGKSYRLKNRACTKTAKRG